MELKDSCYGNKMDKHLQDLVDCITSKRTKNLSKGMCTKRIIYMLCQRLEECEEALDYPNISNTATQRTKAMFETYFKENPL